MIPTPQAKLCGVGLRAPHHHEWATRRPTCAVLEIHAENYFASGGTIPALLADLRRDYPLSIHGVGLGLGSSAPMDTVHLQQLKALVTRYEPTRVSEHLAWGTYNGIHHNDLLPLPYTDESLMHMVSRVTQLQDYLQRPVLIENLSSYVSFEDSTLNEWEFLAALAARSGCSILLDINNLYINACNHGFDPKKFFDALHKTPVDEIHLAGHTIEIIGEIPMRLDTHGSAVCESVWQLYREALQYFGPTLTIIEWDTDLPELEVLLEEAERAEKITLESYANAN